MLDTFPSPGREEVGVMQLTMLGVILLYYFRWEQKSDLANVLTNGQRNPVLPRLPSVGGIKPTSSPNSKLLAMGRNPVSPR